MQTHQFCFCISGLYCTWFSSSSTICLPVHLSVLQRSCLPIWQPVFLRWRRCWTTVSPEGKTKTITEQKMDYTSSSHILQTPNWQGFDQRKCLLETLIAVCDVQLLACGYISSGPLVSSSLRSIKLFRDIQGQWKRKWDYLKGWNTAWWGRPKSWCHQGEQIHLMLLVHSRNYLFIFT